MIATRLLTPLIAVAALISAATVFGQLRDSVEVPRKIDYPKPYVASTIVHAIVTMAGLSEFSLMDFRDPGDFTLAKAATLADRWYIPAQRKLSSQV